jgi:hypothetical protein
MNIYHERALSRNATGLPEIFRLPSLNRRVPANSNNLNPLPPGLSRGGAVVFRRTRHSVSLCNTIAALAGFTQEVDHVG